MKKSNKGFHGMPGGPSKAALVQQAKSTREAMLQHEKDKLTKSYVGTVDDSVRVVLNGRYDVTEIHINPELMSPENAEMVQSMLMAAFNTATQSAREDNARMMASVSSGLNLGGIM